MINTANKPRAFSRERVLGVALLLLGALCANAIPTLINGPYGVVITPANPANVLNALGSSINAWNAANDPDLPPAGAIDLTPQVIGGANIVNGQGVMPPPTPTSITIDFSVEGETYLGLTWDGPNGGTLFYYVGGETGTWTFSSPFFPDANPSKPAKQYGLSHYMFTGPATPVPDGGATVALLGAGLVGLASLRRKLI